MAAAARGAARRDVLQQDALADLRVLLTVTGTAATAYATGATVQFVYVLGGTQPDQQAVSAWMRGLANLVAIATLLCVLYLWRQHKRSRRDELTFGVFLAGAVVGVVRVLAQLALGIYSYSQTETMFVELASGSMIGLVTAAAGTWAMSATRTQRRQARAGQQLAVQRALAVSALEDEEVRVRRDVAEGLHASLQQRLVLIIAKVGEVASHVRAGSATREDAAALDEIREALDRIREDDVRGLSRLLYPDHLEIGVIPAVRTLLRRVPSSVATRLELDPAVRAADDPEKPTLTSTERLLAARVVEEGIGNALRHGHPGELVVALGMDGTALTVSVEDDGGGFDESAVQQTGLARLAQRLNIVGGELRVVGHADSGARLTGWLPLTFLSPVELPSPDVPGDRTRRRSAG